jgi:hypothetical protein
MSDSESMPSDNPGSEIFDDDFIAFIENIPDNSDYDDDNDKGGNCFFDSNINVSTSPLNLEVCMSFVSSCMSLVNCGTICKHYFCIMLRTLQA